MYRFKNKFKNGYLTFAKKNNIFAEQNSFYISWTKIVEISKIIFPMRFIVYEGTLNTVRKRIFGNKYAFEFISINKLKQYIS